MRGALMVSIDINHPDVMEFIKIKRDLSQVTGANISVKLNNEFMKAVEGDEDYILRFPCDIKFTEGVLPVIEGYNKVVEISPGKYLKRVKAKEYWDEIIKSAHNVAEPGIIFEDNHHNHSPESVYEELRGITTNPCFRGDMRLLTADGYKTFSSLNNKEDYLINYRGDTVKGSVWSNGVKDVYELGLSVGDNIFCTDSHVFLNTKGEEKEAKDIIGDRVMPFYRMQNTNTEFTKLGFIQGDGSLSRLNSETHLGLEVHIGEDDNDILDLFGYDRGDEGSRSFYTTEFTSKLIKLGFDGKVLPVRGLPTTYNGWRIEDKKSFLRGLYSANGCIIKNHRISFKTTSRLLVKQLTEALEEIGISSYFTTNNAKDVEFANGTYTCKESYDLNISKYSEVIKFAEAIGFVHSYKTESLSDLIKLKAPKALSLKFTGKEEVFDFNLQDNTHLGVVEGVVVHNCGEIFMQPFDACRLISVNLFSFVDNPFTEIAEFNFEKFYGYNYEAMRLSDDLIDLELEHIDRILNKIKGDPESKKVKLREYSLWKKVKETATNSRRTGLGFTALGDTIAALGFGYDSKESLDFIEKFGKVKMESELDCTIDLAILKGTFIGWKAEKEFHKSDFTILSGNNSFYKMLLKEFPLQAEKMMKYGRRNASWSTIAPTGTVSLMTQTTSGIEPLFQPYYMRRKKVNTSDVDSRVDFTDQNGDTWQEFAVLHPKFKDWVRAQTDTLYNINDENPNITVEELSNDELKYMFESSPWFGSTANDIDWIKRVEIQSILQKYITHSISSTINLPEDVTEAEVSEIYLESWKQGLKGITVYRDGSRSGVLVSNEKKETKSFSQYNAPKRPEELSCKVHKSTTDGKKWLVIIGMLEKKPYEIFCVKDTYSLPKGILEGRLKKVKRGSYELSIEESLIIDGVSSEMTDEQEAVTRLISTTLRHGTDIKFVAEQLGKTRGGLNSFSKSIARVLRKYIEEGAKSTLSCESCGSKNVIFEEGCNKCLDCGHSGCS